MANYGKALGRAAMTGARGQRYLPNLNMTLRIDQLARVFELAERDRIPVEDVVCELVDEAFAARRFIDEALASRESRRDELRDADPLPNLAPIKESRATRTRATMWHRDIV
jgi:hypothetical protein